MKRIIFALCLLIAVTSCVSKKKYMVAENGRLAALSRERVLNRNLGQQKDEIAKLKQQITDLMSDTTRLGQAIRDYRKSLYSNLSEQEKLNMLLKEKMEKLAEREATINKLQAEVDAQNARLHSLLNSVKDALLGFSSDELTVTEKNGKIYVAMSDKLLFESGSAQVNKQGATSRAVFLASVLGVDMGMFYKRRDYSHIVDGTNPIVAHEFLGSSLDGKDVWVVDDMISSGGSMIDVARELKKRNAGRIFVIATFGLFTNGLEKFDKAVEDGLIYKVVTTNLAYQTPELLSREYYISCDMSKYIAYIIDTLNHDASISDLLDPYQRIQTLVAKYKGEIPAEE